MIVVDGVWVMGQGDWIKSSSMGSVCRGLDMCVTL